MERRALAIDFGASSGRAILGVIDGEKIQLQEIHRFDNEPVLANGTLYWDILRLWHETKLGMRLAESAGGFETLGIDTWGVDFGLIDKDGYLLENPIHYRDARTADSIKSVSQKIDLRTLYEMSGIQIMSINTIFQMDALQRGRPALLQHAEEMLFIPDLLGYFLTGKKYAELSIASTSQFLQPYTKEWNLPLLEKLSVSPRLLPRLIDTGSTIGTIKKEICEELSITPKTLVAVAEHDTASAVAAVPATDENFIFISCGTWSLFGTELSSPSISEQSRMYNLTNEVGYGRTTRFLKNISGLWLIQESRRQFKREGKSYSYAEMEQLARKSRPFACFIDPDAPQFAAQGDIVQRVRQFCKDTGQYVPQTDGEVIRCIYESLAMKYRKVLHEIETCTKRHFSTIHLVGGGTKDGFLCQMTADSTGRVVQAGPIEATALGNLSVQWIAQGAISDISHARRIIARSFTPLYFQPQETSVWDKHYEKFLQYVSD